ncbi:MAG TPA: type II toxin-antitoxin system RelE/ParE family toxin [Candidatus Angelobacter sp.]|jgi:addiction module RelE/StbE family toxin|nr:type II toxin-antitoxin system RelE/ParE family toxin [Candidatus Angelobacter sp.]
MRVVWTNLAAADLEEISDYLFEQHPEMAVDTIRRIYQAAAELKQFPSRGRPGRKQDTRELVLAPLPYLVVYEIVEQKVRVLRVLHGARRWPE